MKVLVRGMKPRPVARWWHGREVQCACNTRFLLEPDDEPEDEGVSNYGQAYIAVRCPECNALVEIVKDGD